MEPTRPASPGYPLGPHDPLRLGSYTLLRRLGEGGMGTVYLGRTTDGRRVAVKVIRREFAQVEEFRRRFTREADNARQVRRFCTAEVLDVGTEGEQPYLVTEFVEGPTLSQVISENGPLSQGNLEGVAVGIAQALTAIHGAGIVHRDLKPGNVMLSPYGLRVIDFGIARASDAVGATQVRVGTPAFMAPEQVLDKTLTPALDVFAWGAVVTYSGSGRLPFGGDEGLFERILTAPPDLDGLRGYDVLLPLVERAMQKDPARRPTAEELVARLTGSTSGGVAVADAAVTRVLGGWTPGGATGAGATVPVGDLPSDPHRTPFEPPTAATVMPSAAPPTSPPTAPATPPPPGGTYPTSATRRPVPPPPGARTPAAPPVRTADTPPPANGPAAGDPGPRRGGRRWLLVAAAVVVVAALVVGGILLLGGDKKRTPSGSGSPSVSNTAPVSVPVPRSTALAADVIVAQRVTTGSDGGALLLVRSDGSAAGRQIGDDSPKQLPSLSPDRSTIAYLDASAGQWRLAAADAGSARPLLVGAAAGLKACAGSRLAWNPDGSKVAICASSPAGAGLYVVDPVTGAANKLPSQQRVGDPAWSPKGDLILYWSAVSGDGGPLYTIAADGSGQPTKLTDGVDSQPVWAPNAQHITWTRKTGSGALHVVGSRADGSASATLDFTAGASGNSSGPSYAPSATAASAEQIVFTGDSTGTPLLYTFNPASRPVEITLVPGQGARVDSPSWSSGPPAG